MDTSDNMAVTGKVSITGGITLLCGLLCSLAPAPLLAQAEGSRVARPALEVGHSRESLTNNNADWTSSYLLGSAGLGDRLTVYGGLRETRRFGLDDSEAHAGLYFPIAATWNGVIEGSISQTHNVLSKNSVYGQVQKTLPGGWNVGLGLRQSEYTTISSQVVSLMAERYWGNFRGAYTLYSGRPEGASSASAHRFQFNYYYTDRSTFGLSYSNGREVENVGPPRGVISTDVENWTLGGQHWLNQSWALTYDGVRHEQGSLYRRQGLRLGVRHSF